MSLLHTDISKSAIRSNCEFTGDKHICNTSCKDYRASPFRAYTHSSEGDQMAPSLSSAARTGRASQVPSSGWTLLRISGESLSKSSVGSCSSVPVQSVFVSVAYHRCSGLQRHKGAFLLQPRKASRLTDDVHKWTRYFKDLHLAHRLLYSTAKQQAVQ